MHSLSRVEDLLTSLQEEHEPKVGFQSLELVWTLLTQTLRNGKDPEKARIQPDTKHLTGSLRFGLYGSNFLAAAGRIDDRLRGTLGGRPRSPRSGANPLASPPAAVSSRPRRP